MHNKHQGFTLIELLVVIIIISIMSTVVAVAISSDDFPHKKEARRLTFVLEQASLEAISQFKQIGVVFNQGGYSFAVLNEETQTWASYTSPRNKAFNEYELPEDVTIEVEVDGMDKTILGDSEIEELTKIDDEELEKVDTGTEEEQEVIPQIYFLSSGEASKFKVFMMQEEEEQYFVVEGEITGTIKFKRGDEY